MTDPIGSPVAQARIKISQVDAQTPPVEAERTARLIAKTCTKDTIADLLAAFLTTQQQVVKDLQDVETRIFVVSRALELQSYRQPHA